MKVVNRYRPAGLLLDFHSKKPEGEKKKADAVICDLPVLQYFLKNGGSEHAKLVGEPLTSEDYGIVVSKKNPNLAKAVDQALEVLKKNGTYDKIYDTWFAKGVDKK